MVHRRCTSLNCFSPPKTTKNNFRNYSTHKDDVSADSGADNFVDSLITELLERGPQETLKETQLVKIKLKMQRKLRSNHP